MKPLGTYTLATTFSIKFTSKPDLKSIQLLQAKSDSDRISDSDIVLNLQPDFYAALDQYLGMRNSVQKVDITKVHLKLSQPGKVRLIDLIFSVAAEFIQEVNRDESLRNDNWTRECHLAVDAYIETLKTDGNSYDTGNEGVQTQMRLIVDQIKIRITHISYSVVAPDALRDRINSDFEALFDRREFAHEMSKILRENDIALEEAFVADLHLTRNRESSAELMTKAYMECTYPQRIEILRHHYSAQGWETNQTLKTQQLEQRWNDHVTNRYFLKSIPSPAEFRMLTFALKVRIIIYNSSWFKPLCSSFDDMGTLKEIYDFGPNVPEALAITNEGGRFYFTEFTNPIKKRSNGNVSIAPGDIYRNWLSACRNDPNKQRQMKLLEEGKWTQPAKSDILYKIMGVPPTASLHDFLSPTYRSNLNKWNLLAHADKKLDAFRPVLGEFGPQSAEEVRDIMEIFTNPDCFIHPGELSRFCWQVAVNPAYRYIYHVHGSLFPTNLFQETFNLPQNADTPNGNFTGFQFHTWDAESLDLHFHGYNSEYIDLQFHSWGAQSATPEPTWGNFSKVDPLNISILVKGQNPKINHDLKTVKEDHFQFSNAIASTTRTRAVNHFGIRFNKDTNPNTFQKYAVMIPVRRSWSRVKYERDQYKLFSYFLTWGGAPDLTKIKIVSNAPAQDFPDFATDSVRPNVYSKIADNAWREEWCGLKRCLQGALHYAWTDTVYRNILNQVDKLTVGWIDNYRDVYRADFSVVYYEGTEEMLCFNGITHPSHVKIATLRGLVTASLALMKARGSGQSQMFHDQVLKPVIEKFKARDGWEDDNAITKYFSRITDTDKKKEESMLLIRVLSAMYNVEFCIVDLFPMHDISSMVAQSKKIHFYTTSERKAVLDRFQYNLKNTWIGDDVIRWPKNPVRTRDYVRNEPTQKASRLPIFITWKNNRWELLKVSKFINLTEAEETWRRGMEDREKNNAQSARDRDKEFRGKRAARKARAAAAEGGASALVPSDGSAPDPYAGDHADDGFCNNAELEDEEEEDLIYSGPEDESEEEYDGIEDNDYNGGGGDAPAGRRDGGGQREYNGALDGGNRWGNFEDAGGGPIRSKAERHNNNPSTPGSNRIGLKAGGSRKRIPEAMTCNEDGKEIHFLTQKLPMAACTLKYLSPYGCCNLKIQTAQTEQSKMLAVLFGLCFEDSKIVPIKGCFTSRMVVACKGLRKDIVYRCGMIPALLSCFSLDVQSFKEAMQQARDSGAVSQDRITMLERQAQEASDQVWAEDYRCNLILARTYIQGALEGKVSPSPEYLSPELAHMLNTQVFSKVSQQDRLQNLETIRLLMKSDMRDQLLPLFRVVFHPDVHTWRLTPKAHRQENEGREAQAQKHWDWGPPTAAQFRLGWHR
jgi:hypothetical protein